MKTLVLLSGGMDSAVALGLAVKMYGPENVETVTFNYGSKHNVKENLAAQRLAEYYTVKNHFIELDVQKLIGIERVRQYRQAFKDAGLEEKMLYVFHADDGWDEWNWCIENTKSKYVCFESIRAGMKVLPYGQLMKKCFDAGVRVHALAMTRPNFCKQFPFYSVDSSTWVNVVRFGAVQIWNEREGKFDTVTLNKENVQRLHLSPTLLKTNREKDLQRYKRYFAVQQYVKMQVWMTNLWNGRGITYKEKEKEYDV